MFNKMKKQRAAIHQNDATQIKRIGSRKKYFGACALAVQSDAPDALRALLEKGEMFYFTSFGGQREDAAEARKLVKAAFSSSNPGPLLEVLYDINKTTRFGRLDAQDFLAKDTPIEIIRDILHENPVFFGYCVQNVGLLSTDNQKLAAILGFASVETQPVLDRALLQVVKAGDIEKAKLLLERNANPNYDSGRVLLLAAESKDQDMVDLLLSHVKPALSSDVVTQLQRSEFNVPQAIISSIEAAAQRVIAVPSAAAPQKAADGLKALDDDTLEETKTLSDGARLTTTFNFHAETATILHKDNDGSSVSLEPFNKFSPSYIADMRKKHAELIEEKKPARSRPHVYPTLP